MSDPKETLVPAKPLKYTIEIARRDDDSVGVIVTAAGGELIASVSDGRGTVPMPVLLGEVARRIAEHHSSS